MPRQWNEVGAPDLGAGGAERRVGHTGAPERATTNVSSAASGAIGPLTNRSKFVCAVTPPAAGR
jgi:hypothetical protein